MIVWEFCEGMTSPENGSLWGRIPTLGSCVGLATENCAAMGGTQFQIPFEKCWDGSTNIVIMSVRTVPLSHCQTSAPSKCTQHRKTLCSFCLQFLFRGFLFPSRENKNDDALYLCEQMCVLS